MTIDLTGGLSPEQDHPFATAPVDPEMRQGMSLWISNDDPDQAFGFPRLGLEAVASEWDRPGYSFQAAWPDGRVLIMGGAGEPRPPEGSDGRTSVMGAGPFEMRCVQGPHDERSMRPCATRRRRPSTGLAWSTSPCTWRPRWRCRRGSRAPWATTPRR